MYNGKEVQTVKLDGVVVWQRYVPVPAGSQQVTTSFTVPDRVTVVKPGKTYKVSCGDQYDININDNGDLDIWWTDYMIRIGGFRMGDIGDDMYSTTDAIVIISWSEEINKHATNGSAD